MEYYEKLKAAREDRDLTQRQVAVMLHTKQQQIFKYENGIQEMSVSRLKAFCELYGVSSDYILGLPYDLNKPR